HGQQRDGRRAYGRQAQLDREQPGRRGITREERQAYEQDDQTHANNGVAAQEPVLGGEQGQLHGIGFGRFVGGPSSSGRGGGRRGGLRARQAVGGQGRRLCCFVVGGAGW